MAVVFTVLMVMAGIYALFKWPILTLAVLGVLIVIGKSGENKNGGTAPTTAPPSAKPKAPSSPIKPQAQPTAAVRRCEGRDYEARLLRARTESFKIITMQGEAKAAADILSKASGNVYHVTMTSCECEDFKKGHTPCKHMIYFGALNTIRENILNLYTKKTGREKDEVAAWMDATSWWTGEEAKTNGFVDELVDDGEKTVVENRGGLLFVNSVNMNLPFDKAPKFVQNSVAAAPAASGFVNTQTPAEQPGNNSHKEDTNMANEIKTVDELRGDYPALVDQIEQAAALRATNAERQRIRDIEEMALPGSEQITNEAMTQTITT